MAARSKFAATVVAAAAAAAAMDHSDHNHHHHHHEATTTTTTHSHKPQAGKQKADPLGRELRAAIRHMVANISKSFIVDWYTSISPTNHDFVVSCETLIELALSKMAEICALKLDKYKMGQLVATLLHEHTLNENLPEKIQSVKGQIENHEYDICQNSVVRLFGLLCTDELRNVIFLQDATQAPSSGLDEDSSSTCSGPASSGSSTYSSSPPPFNSDSAPHTTSALYTLVIAMLTKAVFMPIIDSISNPTWLYAVIIWLCKKEQQEILNRASSTTTKSSTSQPGDNHPATSTTSSMQPPKPPPRNSFTKSNSFETNLHATLSGNRLPAATNPRIVVTNPRSATFSAYLDEGIDLASGNINFENPVCDSLKRPLDNIEIYATEEVKSSSSCYVLYCIRYDGICHRHSSAGNFNFIPENTELHIIDKRATANTRLMSYEPSTSRVPARNSNQASGSSMTQNKRTTTFRKMTIKRRFREFVILQLRLEENPKIRPYLKNIPKPTKLKAATQSIFSLPGITNVKLDQSTIRLRQRFLERFLTALNNSPFIANSYEFKEFFSYNLNPSNSNTSKSKSLILQVNFNKVLVDGLRSAFSILKSSIPGDEVKLAGPNRDPDAWLTELQQRTLKLHVQTRTSHSKMNLERYIDNKLSSLSGTMRRSATTSGLSSPLSPAHSSSGAGGVDKRGFRKGKRHSTSSSTLSIFSRSPSPEPPSTRDRNHPQEGGCFGSSKSSSNESVYYDASSSNPPPIMNQQSTKKCNSIQLCNSVPIATKLIDIVHYSLSKDASCSNSFLNFIVRLLLGKKIEKYMTALLDVALTLDNATFCINGITSSVWNESDEPPLDLENASLEEAVIHLTRLMQMNYTNSFFLPKQLVNWFVTGQIRFFLSQLASQERNKFVIYSFFVHLLDELEIVHNQ